LNPAKTLAWREAKAQQIKSVAVTNSPIGRGGGQLIRSWDTKTYSGSNRFKVGNTTEHAKWPEFGTRSPILPIKGEYLTFFSRGRWWKLKRVNGQPPQLFLFNAIRSVFPAGRINAKRQW